MSRHDVNEYEYTNQGFINFLNDLKRLGKVGVLLDEMKSINEQLDELHELINKIKGITLVVSLVPEVLNDIKDKALRRRLTEINDNIFNLNLNDNDKVEILKAYCPDFSDALMKNDDVRNVKNVSNLLNIARDAYNLARQKCSTDDINKDINECIKGEILKAFYISDPEKVSKELEKRIREGLLKFKEEFKIDYIHDKGRRIQEKNVTVDIFFRKGNFEYIGDVKLTNKETVENIENIKRLVNFEKDGEFSVIKFIISNSDNIDLNNFKIFKVNNKQIVKILKGDEEERDKLVKQVLQELKV
ncbi:hypothetical protein [Saccharolobus shibatae]|uniref:Uncharacterized protein n=1 Tax=Saccharolobus shibatae TaxID=2286 RepID=A0A8F5GZ37_9CREN|nr:hypothetical protein [Saccharolobus shibatae]QXJ34933.1 hypothetical protein J5U22_01480 [Saccharolobus shibatae]